eukprot:73681-Pyramimonas_sp.AAC.1
MWCKLRGAIHEVYGDSVQASRCKLCDASCVSGAKFRGAISVVQAMRCRLCGARSVTQAALGGHGRPRGGHGRPRQPKSSAYPP